MKFFLVLWNVTVDSIDASRMKWIFWIYPLCVLLNSSIAYEESMMSRISRIDEAQEIIWNSPEIFSAYFFEFLHAFSSLSDYRELMRIFLVEIIKEFFWCAFESFEVSRSRRSILLWLCKCSVIEKDFFFHSFIKDTCTFDVVMFAELHELSSIILHFDDEIEHIYWYSGTTASSTIFASWERIFSFCSSWDWRHSSSHVCFAQISEYMSHLRGMIFWSRS